MNTLSKQELEKGFVDNKDFEALEIEDVFDKHHLFTIKHHYKRFQDYYVTTGYAGQRKWGMGYPEISKRLEELVSKKLGDEVVLTELELCIYTPDFGYEPKLYPHYDNHQTEGQRVTVSVQIDSNVDWDLFVENKRYKTSNNKGLVFSGTQQIHWRDNLKFKKGDFVAAVFGHFKYKNNKPQSPNQKAIMDYWETKYQEETGIHLDPLPIDPTAGDWARKDEWIKTASDNFFKGEQ